jgi:hypothetical protein
MQASMKKGRKMQEDWRDNKKDGDLSDPFCYLHSRSTLWSSRGAGTAKSSREWSNPDNDIELGIGDEPG